MIRRYFEFYCFKWLLYWILKGVTEAEAGQLSIYLRTERNIIAIFETTELKMVAVSPKR